MKIAILSTSTRQGRASHGPALLLNERLVAMLGKESVDLMDLAELKLPLFEGRYGIEFPPTPVAQELETRLKAADGIIVVTPEYNGGVSPAFNNLMDSLPTSVWADKAFGITTVSAGPIGGMRAALQMQHHAIALMAIALPQMLIVREVETRITPEGKLLDAEFSSKVDGFLKRLVWLAKTLKAGR